VIDVPEILVFKPQVVEDFLLVLTNGKKERESLMVNVYCSVLDFVLGR
jgi:hypothetical protein